MRWLALLGALVLLMVAVMLPRGMRAEPLQVAVGVWPGVESLIMGREHGLLPRDRVQLIDMTWPSAAMRAFGNGVVDAAVLSLDEVLRLREGGHDLRVVMVMDISAGADVVLGGDGVNMLADLHGKRVGLDVRSSGMLLLESALASVDMRGENVDLVPLSPSEVAAAMAEHRVDAVVLAEPWATRIGREGGRVLFDSRQMKLPIYRVLVASAKAVREQRTELRMLIEAHLDEGARFELANDRLALEVVLRREGLSLEEFQHSLSRVKRLDRATNVRLLKPDGELARQSEALEAMMRAAGLLEKLPPSEKWLDGSLGDFSP